MIRILGPDEVDVFRRVRLEALRAEPEAFASSLQDWEDLPAEEWRARLAGTAVFVAFRDDEPVGIMGLARQRSSRMAHRATIIMVYLRRNLRGTGIAEELLRGLTDHARESGIRQLELAVGAENASARRFYQRQGFVEIGRIPAGYLHDGKEIDEIVMARRIVD